MNRMFQGAVILGELGIAVIGALSGAWLVAALAIGCALVVMSRFEWRR